MCCESGGEPASFNGVDWCRDGDGGEDGGEEDACGCVKGSGWSAGEDKCGEGSYTTLSEAECCENGGRPTTGAIKVSSVASLMTSLMTILTTTLMTTPRGPSR